MVAKLHPPNQCTDLHTPFNSSHASQKGPWPSFGTEILGLVVTWGNLWAEIWWLCYISGTGLLFVEYWCPSWAKTSIVMHLPSFHWHPGVHSGGILSTSAWSYLGIKILFSFIDTPTRQCNWFPINQNCWIFGGTLWCDSRNLFWMYPANIQHSPSVAAATMTLSQVIALSLGLCAYADTTDALMALSICWVVLLVIAPMCFGDTGYLECSILASPEHA